MIATEDRGAVKDRLEPGMVRRGRREDADAILGFSAELGLEGLHGDEVLLLGDLIDSADNEVFVVDVDGVVAGWIHVFMARRVGVPAFAEIGGLVTRREFRRLGVGRLLVQRCECWAKQQHGAKLRVRCNPRRDGANTFYRTIGFERIKDQVVYEKNI